MISRQQKSTSMSLQDLNLLDDNVLTEKYKYHDKYFKNTPKIYIYTLCVSLIGVFGGAYIFREVDSGIGALALFLSVALMSYAFFRDMKSIDHLNMGRFTRLLSDSDPEYCTLAIEYAKNCPEARIWRDEVIDKPRPLRIFDFEVMRNFYEKQQAEEAGRNHHSNCLELHGISS